MTSSLVIGNMVSKSTGPILEILVLKHEHLIGDPHFKLEIYYLYAI